MSSLLDENDNEYHDGKEGTLFSYQARVEQCLNEGIARLLRIVYLSAHFVNEKAIPRARELIRQAVQQVLSVVRRRKSNISLVLSEVDLLLLSALGTPYLQ